MITAPKSSSRSPTSILKVSARSAASSISFSRRFRALNFFSLSSFFFSALNSRNAELKTLVALRVELSTASVHWVKSFLDCSGLSAIQIILARLHQRSFEKKLDNDEDTQLECMRCVRGILNTEPGLKAVYGNGEIVLSIVHSLHAESEKLKTIASELLAGLCIVSPKGHA